MALQLSQNSDQGFSYNYHRISRITFTNANIECEVLSYKDSIARSEGKSPISGVSVRIPKASVNLAQNLLPQLYNLLKSGQFPGASDC